MRRLIGALGKEPRRAQPIPQRGPAFRAQPVPQRGPAFRAQPQRQFEMLPTEQSDLTAGYGQGTMQPIPNRNMPMSPAQQQQIAQMEAMQQPSNPMGLPVEQNPYSMPRPMPLPWRGRQNTEPESFPGSAPGFNKIADQYIPQGPMPGGIYGQQPANPSQMDRYANMRPLPNFQRPGMAYGQTSLRKM